MNGLIIFLGESFRLGQQNTRCRGGTESFVEQIKACNSHIDFIEHIICKHSLNSISVFISTYNTEFDDDLLSIYKKYLIGKELYDDVIGLENLFRKSINKVENIDSYDFVLYIRIDLFLKEHFKEIFDPTINMILFPTICFIHEHKYNNHPRVNDTMLFIPKKYFAYLNKMSIGHSAWHDLVVCEDLTYDDMDTMIETYHDSDSYKDLNPIYYIVNRNQSNDFHSKGHIFDKHNF
jgi:hypothetical protein